MHVLMSMNDKFTHLNVSKVFLWTFIYKLGNVLLENYLKICQYYDTWYVFGLNKFVFNEGLSYKVECVMPVEILKNFNLVDF